MSILFCVSFCVFFFFKQKTAYEMRISDWSSDVCSSDLISGVLARHLETMRNKHAITLEHLRMGALKGEILDADGSVISNLFTEFQITPQSVNRSEERRVGKSVSVRVDLGGRRIIKKKRHYTEEDTK